MKAVNSLYEVTLDKVSYKLLSVDDCTDNQAGAELSSVETYMQKGSLMGQGTVL